MHQLWKWLLPSSVKLFKSWKYSILHIKWHVGIIYPILNNLLNKSNSYLFLLKSQLCEITILPSLAQLLKKISHKASPWDRIFPWKCGHQVELNKLCFHWIELTEIKSFSQFFIAVTAWNFFKYSFHNQKASEKDVATGIPVLSITYFFCGKHWSGLR